MTHQPDARIVLTDAERTLARADRLLSVAGAARRLRKSISQIRVYYQQGKLPAVQLTKGKKPRIGIPESAITAIMACPVCSHHRNTTQK